MAPRRAIPCLVGATGSGKTDVGIALARRLGAEVIACDAMTVYRGMPILTAQPVVPPDVPHHLVGVLDPSETYSAARFVEDADRLVREIERRGRVPLVVGGTALYLKAWIKGLGPGVGRDEALRASLEAEADARGTEALHARLAASDPRRAAEVHVRDRRRIVRALEIAALSGRPASEARSQWRGPDRVAAVVVGLRRSREDLARRIHERVAAMAAAGVVDEARTLLARTPPPSRETAAALGLADLREHLEGRIPLEECLARIERATLRFARRQETFFRQLDVRWVDVGPDASPAALAEAVERRLEEPGGA
jgi:tRNA dimethylallyltransferase